MDLNTAHHVHDVPFIVPSVIHSPAPLFPMSYRLYSPPATPQRTPSPGAGTDYSFTTIHSSEAEAYFREEGGRRFPAGPDHPMTLPMDSAEATRLNDEHLALKILLGKNYFGPIEQVLRPSHPNDRRRRRILDVCSAPGLWIQEMAVEFSGVKCVGVDVAPSFLHYPKDNLVFEIYNFPRQGFSADDGSYDVVHARGVVIQIRDLPNLLGEVKRVLRPGGLFLFGEIELEPANADGSSNTEAAGVSALYSSFRSAVEAQGIQPNAIARIDQWIEALGGFQQPVHQVQLFPIGGQWLSPSQSPLKDVGRMMKQNMDRLGASMKPLLLHQGFTQAQVDVLVENHSRDLHNPSARIYYRYHTVYAVRE